MTTPAAFAPAPAAWLATSSSEAAATLASTAMSSSRAISPTLTGIPFRIVADRVADDCERNFTMDYVSVAWRSSCGKRPVFALCASTRQPSPLRACRAEAAERRRLEDQAGFEPAVSLRCRLKRPARSAATVTGPMEDPGGYDPLARGLQGRSLSIRVNARDPNSPRAVSIRVIPRMRRVP